jgi:hypothetical protein
MHEYIALLRKRAERMTDDNYHCCADAVDKIADDLRDIVAAGASQAASDAQALERGLIVQTDPRSSRFTPPDTTEDEIVSDVQALIEDLSK